jgi:hypothetical protein
MMISARMCSSGRETILVDRPGFKPGGWRHALLGGFDSHSLPPSCIHSAAARADLATALLAVPEYGCAARRNLGPLATPTERKM